MRATIGLVLALLLATACAKRDERAQRERDEQVMMEKLLAAASQNTLDAGLSQPPGADR